jgi:hypothetical protein
VESIAFHYSDITSDTLPTQWRSTTISTLFLHTTAKLSTIIYNMVINRAQLDAIKYVYTRMARKSIKPSDLQAKEVTSYLHAIYDPYKVSGPQFFYTEDQYGMPVAKIPNVDGVDTFCTVTGSNSWCWLDATRTGPICRFSKHSCDPNASIDHGRCGLQNRISYVYTLREIKKGQKKARLPMTTIGFLRVTRAFVGLHNARIHSG